jgi:methyl-accepting chemotaxis protein
MTILSRLRLRTKLAMLVGLGALGLVAASGLGGVMLHQRMTEDRVEKLQAVLQSTVSVAQALEARVAAGQLTREQSVAQIREMVHDIRFDGGAGYISVDSPDGLTLMHGANPALEGKPTPVDVASGRTVFALVTDALGSRDSAELTYMFPKPGQTEPLRKVVAVLRFAPWQAVFLAGAYVDDLDAALHASLLRLGAMGGGILLVMLLAAWAIERDIGASVGRLRETMQRLAGGDLSGDIPGTGRRDEMGSMAAALRVFQQRLIEAERRSADEETVRQQAASEKQQALREMADTIEAETGTALAEVSERSAAMAATADEMHDSATRTGAAAQSAATAASQAMANAQMVASAAERLTSSIHEINGQVGHSATVVANAVEAAGQTRATIEALTGEVGRIGAVADMIGEIAARTNLLALNAAIEAARGGRCRPGIRRGRQRGQGARHPDCALDRGNHSAHRRGPQRNGRLGRSSQPDRDDHHRGQRHRQFNCRRR